MTALKKDIVPAVVGIVALTLLLGIVYPLLVTGVSQVAFPGNADGQKIYLNSKLVGSKIIGQDFKNDPRYFQTRPSASDNNAAATAFSNAGPNNKATAEAFEGYIKSYLKLNGPYNPGLTVAKIPVDAVNTSASSIDPDISSANADIQARRVAAVRHLPLSTVMSLVSQYTHGRGLGFVGEPGVNVLQLNLALNRAHP
jgi:K+-transporting ATPase ATPase C chain